METQACQEQYRQLPRIPRKLSHIFDRQIIPMFNHRNFVLIILKPGTDLFSFYAIYPILFVATNSIADFANLTNSKLIPEGFPLKHYKLLSSDPLVPYYKWLYNTYKIAIIAGFFNVFLGTLAAYAFSRLQFKGRRASLLTLVIVQMFPSFLAFVAIYLLFFQISDVAPFMGLGTHIGLSLIHI